MDRVVGTIEVRIVIHLDGTRTPHLVGEYPQSINVTADLMENHDQDIVTVGPDTITFTLPEGTAVYSIGRFNSDMDWYECELEHLTSPA